MLAALNRPVEMFVSVHACEPNTSYVALAVLWSGAAAINQRCAETQKEEGERRCNEYGANWREKGKTYFGRKE
jgi:hypothetical protein